ncbi:hypothetical protein B0H16DRAFT_1882515 [Mycena metata]|uniref:F-box domain-containing protein n=1 Tax=Mycena metata TaxID=1033252 RepID=A0AAD7JL16_9AGAR|nr:hypothetical protein B0H16DRAFT_1882515 [Mycena metata]
MLSSDETLSCHRCGFPESVPPTTVVQSPCPEFLRFNHLPTDAILSDVRREIAIAENGIDGIDEQVRGLKRVLDGLESRRRELQNFAAAHKQVLAPIRTLPSEILSEIFLQYVQHRPTGAWLIARVCRSWREIAISSSRLWNQIDMDTSPFSANISAATINVLRRLLSTFLSHWPPAQQLMETQKVAILEALFPAAHHWREAHLCLDASELRSLFQRLGANGLPTSFPQLTRLILFATSFSGEYTLGTVFRDLPVLDELWYFGDSAGPATSLGLQGVALGQVKKLIIAAHRSRYNLSDLLDTLQLAPKLVDLRFTHCIFVAGPGDGTRTIHLPNLVSLRMSEIDYSLLCYIASPTLQRLTILFTPRARPDPIAGQASILSFLSQPGLSLTFLELCPISQTTEHLLEILAHTPHVRTLKLYFRDPIDRLFLDALACGPGERNLVPHLVYLELEGIFRHCGRGPLVDMLRSRCSPGPLRDVTICGDSEVNEMPRLAGVEITLRRVKS